MSNVRPLPTKAISIEDAKHVQLLVRHLEALRKHRNVLADKRAYAEFLRLRIDLKPDQVPQYVREARLDRGPSVYHDGDYFNSGRDGWHRTHGMSHGKLNTGEHPYQEGVVPTLGTRIMDGIRAAVAEEIEATENLIASLGFAVPPG